MRYRHFFGVHLEILDFNYTKATTAFVYPLAICVSSSDHDTLIVWQILFCILHLFKWHPHGVFMYLLYHGTPHSIILLLLLKIYMKGNYNAFCLVLIYPKVFGFGNLVCIQWWLTVQTWFYSCLICWYNGTRSQFWHFLFQECPVLVFSFQ